MKRKQLEDLGLAKEVIDSIMGLHQVDVEAHNTAMILEKTKITDLTNEVKKFEGVDVVKLKTDVTAWETKYNDDTKALKLNNAIDLALSDTKSKDKAITSSLLDKTLIKLNDDGSVVGLKEQLEKLQVDKAFLFEDVAEVKKDVELGGQHTQGTETKTTSYSMTDALNEHYK